MQGRRVAEDRLAELLAAAGEFFEAHLWDSESGRNARDALAKEKLDKKVIRAFAVAMRGVITVVAALAILEFLLGWALTWLNVRYDELTGRPQTAAQTSPWHRAKRGDRVEDIRSRYGVNAPEKVVAAYVVAGVLVFEIWFFFFAGSSLSSS